jgi:hypothetical protein
MDSSNLSYQSQRQYKTPIHFLEMCSNRKYTVTTNIVQRHKWRKGSLYMTRKFPTQSLPISRNSFWRKIFSSLCHKWVRLTEKFTLSPRHVMPKYEKNWLIITKRLVEVNSCHLSIKLYLDPIGLSEQMSGKNRETGCRVIHPNPHSLTHSLTINNYFYVSLGAIQSLQLD